MYNYVSELGLPCYTLKLSPRFAGDSGTVGAYAFGESISRPLALRIHMHIFIATEIATHSYPCQRISPSLKDAVWKQLVVVMF